MKRLIGLMVVSALAGVGCGDDDDTITDAGTDAVIVIDGGEDAGTRDTGPPPDTGPVTTSIGTPCDPVRGCLGGERCFDEPTFTNPVNSASDPVEGIPAEWASYNSSLFPGGYCSILECDLDNADESCGPGARCINVGNNTGFCAASCTPSSTNNDICRDGYDCIIGEEVCFAGCEDAPDCRIRRQETNGIPGLQTPTDCMTALNCTPRFEASCRATGTGGAAAGEACTSDAACAAGLGCVERVCTPCPDNHVCRPTGCAPRCTMTAGAAAGEACSEADDCANGLSCVDSVCVGCPEDHACTMVAGVGPICAFTGTPATNFDRLHWIPESETDIACNTSTHRCEFTGNAEASAGDSCENDWDCEANGRCLTGDAFPGGFCTKLGCDIAGRGCAGGATCTTRRIGIDLCLPGCTIGQGSDPNDPATWLENRGGCPEGQACLWTGTGTRGACFPGEFNPEVTERNIGGPCTEDSDCWSPFGEGRCLNGTLFNMGDLATGYCTVFDCNAPGRGSAETPVCGVENECIGLFGDGADGRIANCWQGCETADDCQAGFGCAALTEGGGTVCIPGCLETANCRSGQTCAGASGTGTVGRCTAS